MLGSEVGGRWNDEALGLVRDLARCRSLRAPPASSPRVAAALVGAAFRCGAAGRWVHGLGPRMAGSASGPRPARAAAGARAQARRGCGREPPALARLSCLPRTRRGCWSVPAGVSLAMLGKRRAKKKNKSQAQLRVSGCAESWIRVDSWLVQGGLMVGLRSV